MRADLAPGPQGVQAAHAFRQFIHEHPQVEAEWFRTSNTLAFLSVPDEHALGVLLGRAADRGIPASAFREPDLGDSLTAIALGPEGKRLTKGLPLALNDDPQEQEQNHGSRRRPLPLDGHSG